MPAARYVTAQMVRNLPDDGNRYETVHGELLVTPSPRPLHQRVQARLALKLGKYLEKHLIGELYFSPADISWGPDVLVQPDLFVVALEEARALDWPQYQTLLLAVEVLSPSSVRADRFTKRRLYQENGVALYWVIDIDRREVEVWSPSSAFPRTLTKTVVWKPEGVAAPCTISLSALFKPL